MVVWRLGVAEIDIFLRSSQEVYIVISEMNRNPWFLFSVYASIDYRVRRKLWHEMSTLVGQGIPALVIGDFNYIDGPQEKRNGRAYL